MKILAFITISLVFITSCGDIKLPEESQAKPQEDESQIEPMTEDEKKNGSHTSVKVAVDVDVEITNVDGEAPDYIYSPVKRSWQESVDKAPAGYELVSRGQLIGAIEDGQLDEIFEDDAAIWTRSEGENLEMAHFYSHIDKNTTPVLKMIKFGALYRLNKENVVNISQ